MKNDFNLPPEGKHTNEELFHKQIAMLRSFLAKGAISQAQYDKSAGDLARLTGFSEGGNKKEDNA